MKKFLLLLMTLPFLFQSCLKDDDEIFSESAADRLNNALIHHKEVLVGAENGWIMEYFPHESQIYGGYTILVKFDADNQVTVSTERGGAGVTETSMYELIGDSGPVLTFNTHNSLFHYFSEPKNPDGIGPTDSGMKGDYEFLVLEATDEKVTMKGKKTGNRIVMTPIAAGTDWKALMQQYLDMDAKDVATGYKASVNGMELMASVSYRTITVQYPGDNEEVVSATGAYRIVPTGIAFYEPLNIKGVEIASMTLTATEEGGVVLTDEKSGAIFQETIPDLADVLQAGNWYFHYQSMGSFGQAWWNDCFKQNLFPAQRDIYFAYLGSASGFYGFCFAGVADNQASLGVLLFDIKKVAADKVQLFYAGSVAGVGLEYWNNFQIYKLAHPLGVTAAKTFTLKGDKLRNPNAIQLVDDANPDNSMVLFKQEVLWPYPFTE